MVRYTLRNASSGDVITWKPRSAAHIHTPGRYSLRHTWAVRCSLLLLGYTPVQRVTIQNSLGNCNTKVSIHASKGISLRHHLTGPPSHMRFMVQRNSCHYTAHDCSEDSDSWIFQRPNQALSGMSRLIEARLWHPGEWFCVVVVLLSK